jgi:hypothetical protein
MNNYSTLERLAFILLVIGGLNWLLVGAFDTDLVATLFGIGTTLSRAVYILVGLSAIYLLLRSATNRNNQASV